MPSSDQERAMPRLGLLIGLCVIGLAAAPAQANDFDGARVLLCAPVQAFDCAAGEDCAKELPEQLGAPPFLRIDVPNKAVIGPKRTSPILLADKSETQLVLQGTELGYGWTLVVDRETGKLTATLASRENVVVLFGACTVP
jgi:hypothetical protein